MPNFPKASLVNQPLTVPEVQRGKLLRLLPLGLGLILLIVAGAASYALSPQEAAPTNTPLVTIRQAAAVMAQKTAQASKAETTSAPVTAQTTITATSRHEAITAAVQTTAEAAQAEAERLNQIIRSLRLAAAASQELNQANYEVALPLAIEAGRAADTPEAFAVLRQILTRPGRSLMILKGAEQASWNADGSRILTAGCDQKDEGFNCTKGSVRLWDAQTGQELLNLTGPTRRVTQASWNASESRFLTVSEDGLVRVWTAATGQELFQVSGSQVIWKADGSHLLAFGGADGIAQVWDAATGQKLFDLTGHTDWVTQASWNATGSRILTVDASNIARVWNAQTGQELLKLVPHITDQIYTYQANWNADGSRLLTAEGDQVNVWDATTGQKLLSLTDHPSRVSWAGWNSDGSHILTIYALPLEDDAALRQAQDPALRQAQDTARLWDAVTGQKLLGLTEPEGQRFIRASWNADSSRLLTVNDLGTTRLWDTASGQELLRLSGGETWLTAYAGWNPDESRILTLTCDHFVPKYKCISSSAFVWDASTGRELFRLTGHSDEIKQATWNAAGSRLLTTSADGTVRVWDTEPGGELSSLDPGGKATWNADGSRLLTLASGAAQVWDAATGHNLFSLIGHPKAILQAGWNAAGDRLLTAGEDGTARVWDAATGQELLKLSGHAGRVNQATWNTGENRILTRSEEGTVRVWDAATGQELLKLSDSRVMWNSDGSRLLTFDGSSPVQVWDVQTGQELFSLTGSPDLSLRQAVWNSDDSQILTTSVAGVVQVWNGSTGQALLTLLNPDGISWEQAIWNADSRYILTFVHYSPYNDSRVRVWDSVTGQELFDLEGQRIEQPTWNTGGSHILTAGQDGIVRVWDVQTGQELLNLLAHPAGVDQASWNAGESQILTRGCDRLGSTNQHYERNCIESSVRVWDAATGQELFSLTGYPGAVTQATWNASESRLLTVNEGIGRVYYTQMKDLLATACQRAPRNLTRREWALFIKAEPYQATCENLPVENQ